VAGDCVARREERTDQLPTPRPKRRRPRRDTILLIVENALGEILLQRRPGTGIWGGLWSLPEHGELDPPGAAEERKPPAPMRHQFTHFTLDISFRHWTVDRSDIVGVRDDRAWLSPADALERGLPQPIRKLLETFY
jgi:A/G-specific adenine glycosylase